MLKDVAQLVDDGATVTAMTNDTTPERTLFGFTRLAHVLNKGWSGITTGAASCSSGGKTHLFDKASNRTACGRTRGDHALWSIVLVPANVDETTWVARIALCKQCRKAVGA